MSRFRTSFLIGILGALALMCVSASPVSAQDSLPTQEPAPGEKSTLQEQKPPTPWPPKNVEKHQITRRDVSQTHGLILYTPKTWKMDASENESRLAGFSIPAKPRDLTLRVFSFENEKAGGGIQANIDRWKSQFQDIAEKKIWTGVARKNGSQDSLYVLVDFKGTYKPEGGQPLKNVRMLAAIIGIRWTETQTVDGKTEPLPKSAAYFLEMVGPEEAIAANEKHFREAFGAVDPENELKDNKDLEEAASK